ncbi:N-acetylmuramoyl-L-alanine amidase family protein [Aquisalinus flavus]|nr:N-acetylmuramoyl-L-alanine amidase [Aquisalinus flavus]MBD0427526.1 N-acetylmuramoyl-L-alanine amidase [Aquisalinus flavus]
MTRTIAFMMAAVVGALSATVLTGAQAALDNSGQGANVFDVRFGLGENGRTRIVLDISADPHYRAFLRRTPDGDKQLAIEIDQAAFDIGGFDAGAGEGIGHIGTYAYSDGDDGLATLSFDLARTAVPHAVFLIAPKDGTGHYRLVVDMTNASEAAFSDKLSMEYGPMRGGVRVKPVIKAEPAASATADAVVASPEEPEKTQQNQNDDEHIAKAALASAQSFTALDGLPVPRIKPGMLAQKPVPGDPRGVSLSRGGNGRKVIIDAGHGGRDPGAIGQGGTYEKTVTLSAAQQLKTILTERGYEVIMTRDSDVKIELEDRMPRLSKEAADLFISIHADSIANTDVRGASVYTLSRKGDLRLANQINQGVRNGQSVVANVDLSTLDADIGQIVADLSMSRVQEQSAMLANHLIEHLSGRVPMVNNTHRQDNLKVLLAPDVPAVLLELGFMSNIHDEANLIREDWRRGTMTYVADAIDEYMATLPPVRHASLTDGAR